MEPSEPQFFITGGTLKVDAPSYVVRQADMDLLDGLHRGEFCYVLNARQMGKSSLMIRTATRLRAEGMQAAVLDLTAAGKNVSVEQWYYSLLVDLAGQLFLLEPAVDFWRENKEMGPFKRWIAAIREVMLPHIKGNLVIFVDEIDGVRSLPFSTDEFFAGIRECYNRRAGDPEFRRLTFCLLGVATPADLIRDVRTTPFNIGRRIELGDFTPEEARPLARGLSEGGRDGRKLLERILYWTGGHPYLTQRLCWSVSQDQSVTNARGVDEVCDELFLSRRARETDDNLAFVRNRLLMSEVDLASLLTLYRRVLRHERIRDQETDPLISVLRLSGVARAVDGVLTVRNRIYERVFDQAWAQTMMPGAEVRRQRQAFSKGLVIAAAVGGVLLLLLAAILFPVFARARESARAASCRANMRQLGTGLLMYTQDYDEVMPPAYYYRNDKDASQGYVHWSSLVQPYVKNWEILRCPSDDTGGLAPTDFVGNNTPTAYGAGSSDESTAPKSVPQGQVSERPVQDDQAPRLSYVANELVFSGQRKSRDRGNDAKLALFEAPATTIMLGELTEHPNALRDGTTAPGVALSYRPTNAVKNLDGSVFDRNIAIPKELRALAYSDAKASIEMGGKLGGAGQHHICYLSDERHLGGSTYAFLDGHVKFMKLSDTLDPNHFQWGSSAYSLGGAPILRPDSDTPVSPF